MGQTTLDRLEALETEIRSEYGFWGVGGLRRAVRQALDEAPPKGSPDDLRRHAATLRERSATGDSARDHLRRDVNDRLPSGWSGPGATGAGVAATALDGQLRRVVEAFDEADAALRELADAMDRARPLHPAGRARLEYADRLLSKVDDVVDYDGAVMREAHHEAMAGIALLLRCARIVEEAGREAARTLTELASRARAGRITSREISDLTKLAVVNAAASDEGAHDGDLILTADAADRASAHLDRLGADDRQRFGRLLGRSTSPYEQAYLLQALAAGHRVRDIETFDRKIHAHGHDQRWLQQHLTPITQAGPPDRLPGRRPVEFGGRAWAQGDEPTCVAMSTVLARATVDPLYALQLTTGGHPDDPSHDNAGAFADRLYRERHEVYDDGRNWLQDLFGVDGMTDRQARDAANEEVAPHTGAGYHEVTPESADDRREVLAEVQHAVDEGLPVTLSVSDGDGAHQLAIVGHHGGMLEVYNPWGYTVWVSEDDFVDSRLNSVGDGVPATVRAVNVPRP